MYNLYWAYAERILSHTEHTRNEFHGMLSIIGTNFIACWACAEMFKSQISLPIRIWFLKSRVTGPWNHMVSVSAKKVFKKISCLCTFNFLPPTTVYSDKHSSKISTPSERKFVQDVKWLVTKKYIKWGKPSKIQTGHKVYLLIDSAAFFLNVAEHGPVKQSLRVLLRWVLYESKRGTIKVNMLLISEEYP